MQIIFIFILILLTNLALAREQIRIVGSSTLYPYISIAAENFGKIIQSTPVVEATGTGGGVKLFCSGNQERYPDIVCASREMLPSEIALCAKNLVKNIEKIKIGYDGIVIAHSGKENFHNLTRHELFLALSKQILLNGLWVNNFYSKWNQINPNLPAIKIEIYGPSFNSGTRDSLVEIVMQQYGNGLIREDGHYIEMPENDNVIIKKLENNSNALGIINYSLIAENSKIKAIKIDNVFPSENSIKRKEYILARPLFLYVNLDHAKYLLNLSKFVDFLKSEECMGPKGFLSNKGLITISDNKN